MTFAVHSMFCGKYARRSPMLFFLSRMTNSGKVKKFRTAFRLEQSQDKM
jgi:hypothetical protein